MSIDLPKIDDEYFDQVWSADLDVLQSLAKSGDRPELPRDIDVSFRGPVDALDKLASFAATYGFKARFSEAEGGKPWLFLERNQRADMESIRALTKLSLQFEALFGVELDGWGCTARTGLVH